MGYVIAAYDERVPRDPSHLCLVLDPWGTWSSRRTGNLLEEPPPPGNRIWVFRSRQEAQKVFDRLAPLDETPKGMSIEEVDSPGHTEGPWMASGPSRFHGLYAFTVASAGGYELARAIREEDAGLIAAAPELLAALKECAPALARFGYDSESVRKAYEAIAKAEGVRALTK